MDMKMIHQSVYYSIFLPLFPTRSEEDNGYNWTGIVIGIDDYYLKYF